jgi:V-type H+-transporting ATPase subunit C
MLQRANQYVADALLSPSKIAEDDEYALFTVTLFQRVAEEFTHKAREER